ncbi:MAG: hypothetical protein MUP17_04940 [candidate division Zixibacteria bacterium]|nr:hypothetical protein [candidate division Zixibacteria bacterium]
MKQLFLLIPEILWWAWIEWARPKAGFSQQFGIGNEGSGLGTILSYDSPIYLWHIPWPWPTVSWEFPWICCIALLILVLAVDFEKFCNEFDDKNK